MKFIFSSQFVKNNPHVSRSYWSITDSKGVLIQYDVNKYLVYDAGASVVHSTQCVERELELLVTMPRVVINATRVGASCTASSQIPIEKFIFSSQFVKK
jgi:hypothetical protein